MILVLKSLGNMGDTFRERNGYLINIYIALMLLTYYLLFVLFMPTSL